MRAEMGRQDKSEDDAREVSGLKRARSVMMIALAVVLLVAAAAAAQEAGAAKPAGANAGLLGLAAAIAVGLGAIGTAWAQSRIGAAAAGGRVGRPGGGGVLVGFLALPGDMGILGFLVGFFVIGKNLCGWNSLASFRRKTPAGMIGSWERALPRR